ncbi:response regulator [uncultured Lutibacter sp.]|uniref:response regulator n=1 Tax=uncultured Lutibacter sp. TaxID=437739 RepID=UPI0026227895|nr:response regulator [uncultured Lutibacter sp.]
MFKYKLKNITNSNYTISVIIIVTFALILSSLLVILRHNSINNQKQANELLAERYSKIIELNLKGNIEFLKLLEIELMEGNLPESTFQEIVGDYLKNHPELINITWVDSNFTIKSVSPLRGNSHIIGLNIELPMPKKASRLAKELRQTVYTEPFEAIQGESSFEAWNPAFHNNKFLGLFTAVYSSNEVLNTWIDNTNSKTLFSLRNSNGLVITELPTNNFNRNSITTEKELTSLKNGLKLQVTSEINSPFTPLIIFITLLLCLLIFGITYSLWKLKSTQILLKKKELLLRTQNSDLQAAKKKAEESDHLKSAFLANMSHEIRTPMNGILGFADLLKNPELSGKKQQEYIQIIEKGGERLLNIINDIISISKIESGLLEVNLKESNINEQIEYIYNFFHHHIEAKGLQFEFKNDLPTEGANLITDIEKVYAILTNLIKNALKYCEKGSITFGYKLKKANDISELEFYVKDTGSGIPKNRKKAIFERFIQADISDKMAHQGAGLGLSISKAYVEKLGGKIWVESEIGLGSTFYFTLPYQIPTKEKWSSNHDISVEVEETPIRNIKILVAEDDETSVILISLLLQKLEAEVLTAKTGVEAVELCRENPDITLILMDIQMPEMNGYEATRKIRKFNKEVKIIAQTAFGLTGDREKSIEAGCNEYITKPIIKKELFALIKKILN